LKPLSFLKTYRQHNIFLLGATLALAVLIYTVSIRRTLVLRKDYQRAQADLSRAAQASQKMPAYEAQLVALRQSSQQAYDREQLLERVTRFCKEHDLLIKGFPEAQRVRENGSPVVTNQLEVEGRYKDIVRLTYMIEQEERLGSVSSLKFYTEEERRSKKLFLRAQIIIRNLAPLLKAGK